MATYYFDSVNGSDSNNGTSQDTPKASYSVFQNGGGGVAGDTFLFKRGTTQVTTVAYVGSRSGTSDTARTRYGTYGVAAVRYAIWTNPTALGNIVFNMGGKSWVDVEDIHFDATGCTQAIYANSQTTNSVAGLRFYRAHFYNAVQNGLNVGIEAAATGLVSNITVEDCEAYNNGAHGVILTGCAVAAVKRCKFYGNGATSATGGHGFSSRYARTDATSGWTPATSPSWQKTLAANELDVYYVQTSVAAYPRLTKNVSTPTVPASGEFGVSGGILYINVGTAATNPSTQSVRYAWGRCYGLVVEDCESYGNYWNQAAPYHEGHGFAFDDFAENSSFLRNKSYNNQGLGFSINRGDNNLIASNVAYGNWTAAVSVNTSANTTIRNNTFHSNNDGTDPADAEIAFGGYTTNGTVSNNDIESSVSYGVNVSATGTSGFSGTKNNITGHKVAAEKNPLLTGTTNVASKRDALYRPQAPELIRSGANLGGRDFYGKQFYATPNIGAVEDVTNTPRYGLVNI